MYSSSKYNFRLSLVVSVLIAALMLPSLAMATPEGSDIDSLRAQARSARLQLDQLAYETELASENYFEAQELLEATLSEIELTEEELADSQVQLDRMSGLLSERATNAYVNGELSFIVFLFESSSLNDFFARISLLQTIMDNDATIISDVRHLRSEIQVNRDRLEEKREIEREAAERAETEFQNVQTSLNAQQRLLSSLDSEVERLIAEERAAIEAEQIRLAQQRQAEEERARAAREVEEASQSAEAEVDSPDATASTSNSGSNSNGSSSSNTASNSTAGNASSSTSGSSAGTSSSTGSSASTGSSSSSGSSASTGSSTGSGSSGSSASTGSSSGSSGSGSSTGGSTSSGSQTPSLGRERPGVVTVARRFVGVTPYLWGGTTPAGFDCSGLVQYSYREAYGINLPRTSRQQFHAGVFIPPNRSDLMRPGDLVFFSRTGRPENIHHVGIFIGNNRMIHAPSSGRLVSEQAIWRSDFIGAVRP